MNLGTGVRVSVRPPAPRVSIAPPRTTVRVVPVAGPAGQDGADGSDRPALLTGTAAPLSGSGLDPLDGVNDPWRWSAARGGWVSPAYDITWTTGAVIPSFEPVDVVELDLLIGSYVTAVADPPGFVLRAAHPSGPSTAITMGSDGSGVAFLIQYEADFGGPTALPDPTLDITTMLGDAVIVGPHVWNEDGDGQDGDYWRNSSTGNVYGPKTVSGWGATIGKFFDNTVQAQLPAGLYAEGFAEFAGTVVIDGSSEPADDDLGNSQTALWYEDTTGAPVVHFKGKDSAGAVFDLTPTGGTGGGTSFAAPAGATLSGHRVVRAASDGSVVLATNADIADCAADVWLTTGAAATGDPVTVLTLGRIDEPSWSWSSGPVWLGADGLLTQTLPTAPSAQFLRQVGSAVGPTALYFNPRSAIAL